MSILPRKLRYKIFDAMSKTTMRYVATTPMSSATGIAREVYEQINRDFFINGSLTSRSKVTSIFAATWMAGRETIIVDDKLDRVTKEALAATLSSVNDCPYCGDMLVSLVHAADQHENAEAIFNGRQHEIKDSRMRDILSWVMAAVTPGVDFPNDMPFTEEELPEVLGSIMAMSDINAFSHVVMDGSPVKVPMGSSKLKALTLRLFGTELVSTQKQAVEPGISIPLLPAAELPEDMGWARANPRIAETIARWISAIDTEAASVISPETMKQVNANLASWDGTPMPMSRAWLNREVIEEPGVDANIARLALVIAKARHQLDDRLIEAVLADCKDDETFIRILAWCANLAARSLVRRIAANLAFNQVAAA